MVLTLEQKLIKFNFYTGLMDRHFENENITAYALMKIRKLQVDNWALRVTKFYDLLNILTSSNQMALKEQAILILSDTKQQIQATVREYSDSSSSTKSSDSDASDSDTSDSDTSVNHSDYGEPGQDQNQKKITRNAAVQTQDIFEKNVKSKVPSPIV